MLALRKRLLGELQAARSRLARRRPSDAAIHGARQHIKRARAILRLLRPVLGSRAYRQINLALRDVNRALRQARDYAVVRQTLRSIVARRPQLQPASRSILAFWRGHRGDGRAPAAPSRDPRSARAGLTRAAAAIRRRRVTLELDDNLRSAIRVSYRQAQKAYRHAVRTGSDADWHECRKQTKYLCYQLQLVQQLALRHPRATRAARLLESVLGRERDLALLAAELRRTGVDCSPEGSAVQSFISHRRARLRYKSAVHGGRLFREKAGVFARRLQSDP